MVRYMFPMDRLQKYIDYFGEGMAEITCSEEEVEILNKVFDILDREMNTREICYRDEFIARKGSEIMSLLKDPDFDRKKYRELLYEVYNHGREE